MYVCVCVWKGELDEVKKRRSVDMSKRWWRQQRGKGGVVVARGGVGRRRREA